MKRETGVQQNTDRVGLMRYVMAATLARMADGGAVLAVILLCVGDSRYVQHAGTLAACITFPHLLGPFVARKIDTANDGRRVIACACLLYAVFLFTAVFTFTHVSLLLTAALLIAAGLCGPLLTGGISSRLPSIVGADQRSQRSAQGWDVATYGLGGTLGPSLVASLSAWYSPPVALYLLAAGTTLAAFFIMRLPRQEPSHGGDVSRVPGALRTLQLIGKNFYLRRTLCMTIAVAFAVAALPVMAVSMAPDLGVTAASAALLTVGYGGGNLAGSLYLMARPLRGRPDRLMLVFSFSMLGGIFLILHCGMFVPALACFFFTGMLNAGFFAATLAARTEYSPVYCRGQVFLWVAAMKITAGSLGTASAGKLMLADVQYPLMLSLIVIFITVAFALTENTWRSLREE